MKYKLDESKERHGWFIATDTTLGMVVRFKKNEFNETQEVVLLEDIPEALKEMDAPTLSSELSKAMNELTQWLIDNYPEIL